MGKLGMTLRIAAIILFVGFGASMLFFSLPFSGWKALSVQTGSMEPEIPAGSLVFVQGVPVESLGNGDVITFKSQQNEGVTITHRIVNEAPLDGGLERFVTKGDANDAPDPVVYANQVVGKVQASVPGVGSFMDFAKSPLGLILLIYIPALLIAISEIRLLVRRLTEIEMQKRHGGLANKMGSLSSARHSPDKSSVKTGALSIIGAMVVLGLAAGGGRATFSLLTSNATLASNRLSIPARETNDAAASPGADTPRSSQPSEAAAESEADNNTRADAETETQEETREELGSAEINADGASPEASSDAEIKPTEPAGDDDSNPAQGELPTAETDDERLAELPYLESLEFTTHETDDMQLDIVGLNINKTPVSSMEGWTLETEDGYVLPFELDSLEPDEDGSDELKLAAGDVSRFALKGGMLMLKDQQGDVVDQISWGDNTTFNDLSTIEISDDRYSIIRDKDQKGSASRPDSGDVLRADLPGWRTEP